MEKKTTRQQIKTAFRWIGWVLLVQFILINICASLYAYKLTHFYEKVDPDYFEHGNIFTKSWKIFSGPKYAKLPLLDSPSFHYEELQLKTTKNLLIKGWYGKSSDTAKGTVILFHGISANRIAMLEEADACYRRGYNVLLFDFRAHGTSDGNTTTIGFREGEEVKLAFDFVKTKGEKNIFLYGGSMGAVSITRSVYEYGLNPTGIILDAPFLSLQSYLKAKARILGFPDQPFAFLTTFWIGVERGFNGFSHNTTRYVPSIRCPVLMQWGSLDNFVLREETEKIFTAIGTSSKKLVIYNGAYHESLLRRDPLKWRIEVGHFLDANSH